MRLASWHRRLAGWLALPVLAWSLTGLLHPLMSRWQPSAAERQPPVEMLAAPEGRAWSDYPAPARVLPGELRLRELRALTWQGSAYWLLQRPSGEIAFVDARDGQAADIERELVTALARHYTGERQAAVSLSRVTGFSDEYPFVNRYLPVWRVAFARPDGLMAFIEPRGLLLAGLTDTWKTRFTWLFGNLHSWKWLNHESVRDAAMTLVLGTTVVLVLSGLLRVRRAGARRPALRRWHRRLGLFVSLAALAWLGTGIFHVLVVSKSAPTFPTYPLRQDFAAGELRQPAPPAIPAGARLQVVATALGPLWHDFRIGRPQQPGHHHGAGGEHAGHGAGAQAAPLLERYVSARDGHPLSREEAVRDLLATVAPKGSWTRCEPVTAFAGEYGFVQKRLPVCRVALATPDHLAVYVDPADRALAAVVDDVARLEGTGFSLLHKANWLEFLGKDLRDAILALFALLVAGLTGVGLRLLWRGRRT